MKMKRFLCSLLSIIMVFTVTIPALANSEKNIGIKGSQMKYTVQDIKTLGPYVSVENGYFVFDVKSALKNNVDNELIQGQLEYFKTLNNLADKNQLQINDDLSIVDKNTHINLYGTRHAYNCGGGILRDVEYHWWGVSRYTCDCVSRDIADAFATVSTVAGGAAIIGEYFAPILVPCGITALYFQLLSTRINANNRGRGVYIAVSWALVFDIEPQ